MDDKKMDLPWRMEFYRRETSGDDTRVDSYDRCHYFCVKNNGGDRIALHRRSDRVNEKGLTYFVLWKELIRAAERTASFDRTDKARTKRMNTNPIDAIDYKRF